MSDPITMKVSASVDFTVEQLAEAFADMDNHQQLRFIQHAVALMNTVRPGAADYQALWICNADMDQDTRNFLACLDARDGAADLARFRP